ncbi:MULTISPECIES: glutathione S-transferase family protein [unclassified Vibrio]|uniref:glutathione S-transferase family protein n=1 Tax=unclassified Vibrio TaxID=2614977 RepID=UPI001F18C15A|nr:MULTISPECIES: glutathione S-transferase family protein [unclassified Vibrio]QXL80208.1 Stringent starvation protein A [Vibrio sp.]
MKAIELVSYEFCPFVQPAIITLLEKEIPFKLTYLDLDNKPKWFTDRVPSGQSPALIVDESVLTESYVINEYLDEITSNSLHPKDVYGKANNRVWIKFSYQILDAYYETKIADSRSQYEAEKHKLINLLKNLETEVQGKNYFNGDEFCLVDTFFAPVFRCIALLDNHYSTKILKQTPGLMKWSENLLNRESVKKSISENFNDISIERIKFSSSILNNDKAN